MTVAEIAYTAGLFDGEGTIGYYYKTSSGIHIPQLAIYNTDIRVMRWIKDKFGVGGIYLNKFGKNQGWQWQLNSRAQINAFLRMIRPYLIIKADQVDLLFSLWDAERGICGSGKRLSKATLALRVETEAKLKQLKTANLKASHH